MKEKKKGITLGKLKRYPNWKATNKTVDINSCLSKNNREKKNTKLNQMETRMP